MNKIEEFVPKIIEESQDNLDGHRKAYALMLVELDECPICKKMMLYVPEYRTLGPSTFPIWNKVNIQTQLEKAGWVFMSREEQDGKKICKGCSKEGKTTFLCAFCGKRKPTSKIEERIGGPGAEYLCTDCYETKSAKEWHDKVEKLTEVHRYDYE